MTPDKFTALKRLHPGCVLLFRVTERGYPDGAIRVYAEDAELLVRLFGPPGVQASDIDEFTFPTKQLDGYLARLTQNGHRCAIVAQDGTVQRVRMPGERKDGQPLFDMLKETR